MAYTTIDDPSAYFQIKLYSGNSTNNTAITNDGNSNLQPDWIWAKSRTNAHYHDLRDSSRGVTKRLVSNEADAESTKDQSYVSFDSDGFTLGDDTDSDGSALNTINTSSNNYVAWQWKANGGTVANDTNGDITTSVQANQTAGFSIATYTGNGGSNQTLGHGLGAEPDFVIFKDRDSSSAWRIFVRLLGASKFLNLNTTDTASASTNIFPSHSSTTIGVEQNDVMNKNSSNHIMYSFRSIQGYSKIGQYEGNNSADGTFIYLGFKPSFMLIKNIDGTNNWMMLDNKRDTDNPVVNAVVANGTNAEFADSGDLCDFLSNGVKMRVGGQGTNNAATFIYMAFAEHPFVSSKGVPVTAR